MLVVAGRILIRASLIGLFLLGFGSAAFAQDLTRGVGVHSMSSCAKVSGCLNLDASIAHPEAITGSWETRVASGEIVGLSIAALTSVSGAPTSLVGLNQHVQFYRLVTYVRDGGSTKRTWWHTAVDGYFDWQQNRLHFRDSRNNVESATLDLTFYPATSTWEGLFTNVYFSGYVVLRRPHAVEPTAPLGTWASHTGGKSSIYCIHIAMGEDERLVIWDDSLSLSGFVVYSDQFPPPLHTDQSYGELAEDPVEQRDGRHWHFQVGNGLGGNTFDGEVSTDGNTFSGTAMHFGNGSYRYPPPDPRNAFAFSWSRADAAGCST